MTAGMAGRTVEGADPSPLIDMAMSIQFAALTSLRTPYVGLLWGNFRDRYRQGTEAPPVPPQFEMFGGPAGIGGPQLTIQLNALVPRIVFEGVDGDILLHVQQDRLILGWRRYPSGRPYPGYETLRDRFMAEVSVVEDFLKTEGLGEIRPNQCELTYVNALLLPGKAAVHERLDSVTPMWRPTDTGLPFDSALLQNRYLIPADGEPTGRLYTTFSPAVLTATGEPNYQLEIVARCRPSSETIASAFAKLDSSHDLIGRAFRSVTSSVVRASGGE
ncbi:TIGR04255 family protein [Methylobacterium sp. J-048]|uniref:TIGR04255 family protein n=1 Tax=Methylobacterium sp. J-048 TaxID=2836635 RepID=UPI001FB9642A|nr:TIGR04255 family protein [Methylobacterium sp. J-048]MCJ2059874.1 TIGR04255 family protein [Methylobacterium sp. J-048]